MRAAGSILKAHASRGRRAALLVNSARPGYQRVHSLDGDWHRALELLAAVEPDGHTPVANLLADEAGAAARALELTVVTSALTPRLAERLPHRAVGAHAATLVYVDAASFDGSGADGVAAAGDCRRCSGSSGPVSRCRPPPGRRPRGQPLPLRRCGRWLGASSSSPSRPRS